MMRTWRTDGGRIIEMNRENIEKKEHKSQQCKSQTTNPSYLKAGSKTYA